MISVTLNFDNPEAAKAFLTFDDKARFSAGTPPPLTTSLAASAIRSAEIIVRADSGNIISGYKKIKDY